MEEGQRDLGGKDGFYCMAARQPFVQPLLPNTGHTPQPDLIVITNNRARGTVVRELLHHRKHTNVYGAAGNYCYN